jgi:lysophospholipase L1-like esterase
LKVVRDGKWNVDPDPPARRALQDDGVFGFAGTRAVPGASARFRVELSPRPASPDEVGNFELSYVLPAGASFDVELGERRLTVSAATSSVVAGSGISHLRLAAPLRSHLTILPRAGSVRLFGVVIERSSATGVVLDTAGIDGARLETPLAWNETAFVAEVAHRAPDLFVVAYGTNEAFDALRVDKYQAQLAELVRRLRRAAPQASCLVLGPTDAPLGEGSVPRVADVAESLRKAAARHRCSFVSLQQLMGGEGSFARGMRAKERLCQLDKLHLTPKGYQELGRALVRLLLDAYSTGGAELSAPVGAALAPVHAP